jgi:recombinational DNA repair protein (RecF pathway)
MMRGHHTAAPASIAGQRRCSRCGETKPPAAFYRNPATICKECHNRASRFTSEVRRAAIADLIATHQAEYLATLKAERVARAVDASGGGSNAA